MQCIPCRLRVAKALKALLEISEAALGRWKTKKTSQPSAGITVYTLQTMRGFKQRGPDPESQDLGYLGSAPGDAK